MALAVTLVTALWGGAAWQEHQARQAMIDQAAEQVRTELALAEQAPADQALDRLAAAWIAAPTPALQERALQALTRLLVDQHHAGQHAALEALTALGPVDPGLAKLEALHRRDLEAALRGPPSPLDGALENWRQGRLLVPTTSPSELLERDGDRWLFVQGKGFQRLHDDLTLGPFLEGPTRFHGRPWLWSTSPLSVVGTADFARLSRWHLEGDALVEDLVLERPNLQAVMRWGDTLYAGFGPPLRSLAAHDGGWRVPDPALDAADSDVLDLAAADLDGDGEEELAVAQGAWRAFAVRLYERGDSGLEPITEAQLGLVDQVEPIQGADGRWRLAALKTDQYGSATVFGEEHPNGEPQGLYVLALDDGALVTEQYLPFSLALFAANE